MKNLIAILAILFSLNFNAQQLNDKGLYVTSDNELFNGTITATNNGIKSEITVKNGIANGEAIYFFASGKVMEKGMFTEGRRDQQWTRFNENGTTSAVAFYNLGKKTGTWLVFDNNGNKRFEMMYKDGEKTGIWTTWDENGMVISTKDYTITN